jgi:hypothetical protein
MSGNSNSGRPKLYEEFHKINAINKLWQKVERKITEGEELTEWEKTLVGPLLSRTIKTETDITSGNKPLPILGGLTIKSDVIPEDNSTGEDSST